MSDDCGNLSSEFLDEVNQIDSSRLELIPLLLDLTNETYKYFEADMLGANWKNIDKSFDIFIDSTERQSIFNKQTEFLITQFNRIFPRNFNTDSTEYHQYLDLTTAKQVHHGFVSGLRSATTTKQYKSIMYKLNFLSSFTFTDKQINIIKELNKYKKKFNTALNLKARPRDEELFIEIIRESKSIQQKHYDSVIRRLIRGTESLNGINIYQIITLIQFYFDSHVVVISETPLTKVGYFRKENYEMEPIHYNLAKGIQTMYIPELSQTIDHLLKENMSVDDLGIMYQSFLSDNNDFGKPMLGVANEYIKQAVSDYDADLNIINYVHPFGFDKSNSLEDHINFINKLFNLGAKKDNKNVIYIMLGINMQQNEEVWEYYYDTKYKILKINIDIKTQISNQWEHKRYINKSREPHTIPVVQEMHLYQYFLPILKVVTDLSQYILHSTNSHNIRPSTIKEYTKRYMLEFYSEKDFNFNEALFNRNFNLALSSLRKSKFISSQGIKLTNNGLTAIINFVKKNSKIEIEHVNGRTKYILSASDNPKTISAARKLETPLSDNNIYQQKWQKEFKNLFEYLVKIEGDDEKGVIILIDKTGNLQMQNGKLNPIKDKKYYEICKSMKWWDEPEEITLIDN